MANEWTLPRISTEYAYRGIDAAFLENRRLRIMVLPGKGGDIVEFRDKRTDVDVLWHADHNWQPPGDRPIPTSDPTAWHDTYPGGWQVNLPVAGYTDDFGGTPYGLHGESALIPWEAEAVRSEEEVSLRMRTELVRYPLALERELRLPADEARLEVDERVTNASELELEYIWQQHVALGLPLIGPRARLDLPAKTGVVDEYGPEHENARLQAGETFSWPDAPGDDGERVDLREFPPTNATIHDVAYATELEEGWYAITNADLDLGFGFTFPTDPFECVWYWQPFGGYADSPYFNRNYNVGLEPTTAYPSGDVPDAQRENGTMKTIGPGETLEASFHAVTYGGLESVATIDRDGSVNGPS